MESLTRLKKTMSKGPSAIDGIECTTAASRSMPGRIGAITWPAIASARPAAQPPP